MEAVLIANRGEIARRVVRACREAGLRSVAIHTALDADAPHVHEADAAVAVPSYLDVEAVVAAAHDAGADAVHPGYGFLSENAGFARAVVDAGLTWIGPSPEVIDLMGRKDRAREVAERADVPVTTRHAPDAVPADAYPVLVKAAAGGGGKGMHVVREPGGLADALATAAREAASAFGDDTLLVEQYVEGGRHVEVQVFGDSHGNVVHLFTRDCSAQRRHQKVVEEAPAPDLADEQRARLQDSAVALAREVSYVGAGTVEFLVAPDGDLCFLEMNTRLQVEHPVTEEVTGVDLVRWQLDVAAGATLPPQDDLVARGHAIEARIYAEDPYAGFLPQAGTVADVLWPEDLRVESAIDGPGEVSTAYDPMLAKIVATGPDRASAVASLADGLARTAVLGVTTNIGFVRRLLLSEEFAAVAVDTAWLDGEAAESLLVAPELTQGVVDAAVGARAELVAPDAHGFGRSDGWRLGGGPAPWQETLMDPAGGLHRGTSTVGNGLLTLLDERGAWVVDEGHVWRLDVPHDVTSPRMVAATDADVTAPMPGTVLDVRVEAGDRVQAGDRLGTLEAMKMELALTAPHDGVVAAIGAEAGRQVPMHHVLFTVEAGDE